MKKLFSVLFTAVLVITPMTDVRAEANKSISIEKQAEEMAAKLVQNYGVTSLQYAIRDQGKSYCRAALAFTIKHPRHESPRKACTALAR